MRNVSRRRLDRTLFFDFPDVPQPFELRRAVTPDERVEWTSIGVFPPHWAGTVITWTLSDDGAGGTRVLFRHTGWADDDPGLPSAAYTWGQLMVRLKTYVENGTRDPLFVV